MNFLKLALNALALTLISASAFAAPVNVNRADAATIAEALNGIGVAKAQAIVSYREEHGPFKSIDALIEVKGIGVKTLEKNRADILLADGKAAQPKQ
jgi:competence protein ComEA